jgi:hypothetical protein
MHGRRRAVCHLEPGSAWRRIAFAVVRRCSFGRTLLGDSIFRHLHMRRTERRDPSRNSCRARGWEGVLAKTVRRFQLSRASTTCPMMSPIWADQSVGTRQNIDLLSPQVTRALKRWRHFTDRVPVPTADQKKHVERSKRSDGVYDSTVCRTTDCGCPGASGC